jgi:hypothetical protein
MKKNIMIAMVAAGSALMMGNALRLRVPLILMAIFWIPPAMLMWPLKIRWWY